MARSAFARRRLIAVATVGALAFASCASDDDASPGSTPAASEQDDATGSATQGDASGDDGAGADDDGADGADDAGGNGASAEPVRRFIYPDAPPAPAAEQPSDDGVDTTIDAIIISLSTGMLDQGAVTRLREAGDARHAWLVSDLLRFFDGDDGDALAFAFRTLTGIGAEADPDFAFSPWLSVTNHLIAWDTPAYPGYAEDKGRILRLIEPRWEPFFDDTDATVDWRLVSWGGVLIDDRPLGDEDGCRRGCIPALDDPAVTDAAGGDWYPEERVVFGIVEGDEALAIPLHIAEIHEMFNLTLGGRRLGIPYCTLCGSAQAYYTDVDPQTDDGEPYVLRTSGLLSRSNKVMYELGTSSVFDTFTGAAASGPLREAGVILPETTVVRSTWGAWKAEHPDTMIIAEDGGIGRSYELDPLGGRDDNGPIFPVGGADDRLDVQTFVVGVITDDGTPVAFDSEAASAALAAGEAVVAGGVELQTSGDGLVAVDAASGAPLVAHEAFWFAWSQFHPSTVVWEA